MSPISFENGKILIAFKNCAVTSILVVAMTPTAAYTLMLQKSCNLPVAYAVSISIRPPRLPGQENYLQC